MSDESAPELTRRNLMKQLTALLGKRDALRTMQSILRRLRGMGRSTKMTQDQFLELCEEEIDKIMGERKA
jgi:hypothetical protein